MRKTAYACLLVACTAMAAFTSGAAAAATSFTGSLLFIGSSATYSITTDGTIGAISAGNITAWTVTEQDYLGNTDTFGSNTYGYLDFTTGTAGSGITSDGTNLYYNYGVGNPLGDSNPISYARFSDNNNFAGLCFEANDCASYTGGLVSMFDANLSHAAASNSESGIQVIATATATAVPEPGTWAMMLIGFGTIGWAVRRRRKSERRSKPSEFHPFLP